MVDSSVFVVDDLSFASGIAEIAADPQALHWARECAWVPGTGHCRNRPCSGECVFRSQRVSEAARVIRSRRVRRRRHQRGLAWHGGRTIGILMLVGPVVGLSHYLA
jgi:hypothetical protein